MSQEIANKIREIVAEKLGGRQVDEVQMDLDLKNGFGVDSLTVTEIVLALEEEYLINLEDDALILMDNLTVNKLIEIVEQQLQPV